MLHIEETQYNYIRIGIVETLALEVESEDGKEEWNYSIKNFLHRHGFRTAKNYCYALRLELFMKANEQKPHGAKLSVTVDMEDVEYHSSSRSITAV